MLFKNKINLLITNQFINVNPIRILQIRFNNLCFCLVVSDTLPSFGLQPARLLCLWKSSGKNTGVGCHFPHAGDFPNPGIKPKSLVSPALQLDSLPAEQSVADAKSLQSCLTVCDCMESSLPGSSVQGVLQARILGLVATSSSRVSSYSRDWTCVSWIFWIGRQALSY